ncbi:hypothetical protein BHF71_05435 [Vulcanibacillus modesticaldus]|uniref:Putative zinc-finger domain-containing protein n=1 Tax=Vulcanibacillus modesticaldus TaxID=337097 RepID=A0A1D2YWU3_9BACI|nr:zf-HC2 domain-containing protein [Vulcanibacillus modesticaldus]OEG00231.1 hypothetical protein BHF71_05435 [Vulcanibacillus modesticaldus]
MKCHETESIMHAYLDDDIDGYPYQEFLEHIKTCHKCKKHFEELKITERLLKQLPMVSTPPDFVQKLMQQLPQKESKTRIKRWLVKYPVVVAASIFLLLFSISLVTYMEQDNELKIVTTDQAKLIVKGNEVIVPEGKKIIGDLIIENGNLKINGEVKGNVTVINGDILMANASQVDGHTKQIDRLYEWIWYNLKNLWTKIPPYFIGG